MIRSESARQSNAVAGLAESGKSKSVQAERVGVRVSPLDMARITGGTIKSSGLNL